MTSKEGLHRYYYDDTYQLVDVTYPDQRTGHYEYDVMGNRIYVDEKGEALDYTLKPNGLNQYDAVSKSKQNIDVKGTVTGTSPTVKVNGVTGKINGTSYLAEDVTLNSGANTLTATATNAGGSTQASVSVTLDTVADKLFTYDSNDSLTRSTFGTKQANYTYDYENRVVSITQTGLPNATYKYDYLGRRIEKNIGGTITKYIYDGDNIIAEYNGSVTLVAKYVYGPSIDEPIRIEKGSTICYYHFDGLGSVTDLSNSSGAQIEHYYYLPFGKTKIYNASGVKLADSAYGNYYRFTARQWDPESSLYYYRARYYDPNLGRFLQADPVGYDGGDLNLYGYSGNNPINYRDPTGLCREKLRAILAKLLQLSGVVLTSTEFDAALGALEQLGEMGAFAQSRNPATGLLLAGHHLEYKFKGLGNLAAKLAKPLAILGTGGEIAQIWRDDASVLNKVLKSVTAASVNTLTFIGAGGLVAATATTGPGIALGVAGTVTIGAIGDAAKTGIYEHIDANLY